MNVLSEMEKVLSPKTFILHFLQFFQCFYIFFTLFLHFLHLFEGFCYVFIGMLILLRFSHGFAGWLAG